MSFIQNLFTSRDNNANAETYVGQQGRIWWDPTTNRFYYSDGSTPGGIPIGGGGNGSPGGTNTQVQFNSNGSFGGSSNFTFNGTTVTITGNVAPGNILTNNYLYANGVSIFGNTPFSGNTNFSNISVSGTANLGNFVINDQTMSGTIDGRDITYTTVGGNANLVILGGFKVHSANLELQPEFQVDTNGRTRILVSDTSTFNPSFQVIGSADGSYVTPQFQGVMMHVTGQPSTPSRIYNDGASNYSVYVGRRYNGTSAAPTGVLSGQIMTRFAAAPYTTANAWANISTTRIDYVATENQTTLNQGSKIEFYTTPDGANATQLVATFEQEGIILSGNVIPTTNNAYNLGNNTNKWNSIHIGPDSIFIEDSVLGTDAELTVADGALLINGTQKIQIGNMQMTTTGISLVNSASNANLIVGQTTNTGYLEIDMLGIKFKDNTLQTTAAIPLSQRGNAGGVATLGLDGIVPASQLPAGGISYQGTWNAATNTPTLADGTGSGGDEYAVIAAGTQNLGSGAITFAVGDFVIYNGTIWQKIPGGSGVTSFNTRTGAVTLQSGDVTNALSNGSITNNFLNTDSWDLTVGQGIGLTGNGTVELGDSITLTNTGVTAAIGGTGVAVSAATGNVTFSIGQPVGTANSVSFLAVTANTTIQATGNITGGNIATAGRIVATGNVNAANFITSSGTLLNNGLDTTGNIRGGNLVITGIATVTGNITGGNIIGTHVGNLTGTTVSASGNITGGNISTAGRVTATGNVIGGNLVGQNLTPTRVTFVGSGKEIDDDAEFTYDDVTNTLSVGNISASGNVTAAFFIGNGTALTGVATSGFSTVNANGTSLVADSTADTLNFASGNNLIITGTAGTDTATFAVSDAPTFTGNVTAPNFIGNIISANNISNIGNVFVQGNIQYNLSTGDGGNVVQLTNKATAVTCNGRTGRITTSSAAMAGGSSVTFVVNNTYVQQYDLIILNVKDPVRANTYHAQVNGVGTNSFNIMLRNIDNNAHSDAIVLSFALIQVR
jgi:hypothetical protein